ncbi:unnamed protein product [Dimorphilus gyrociliatus]|uniref:Uncharacterized protein n=1 Tax=Dimorphilus gyrociliatus TaxID=2664684 RepID=A0A7I8VY79_9ANNE|nr:unnamed protein product [Dimorphilus gyrociliatus]
MKKNPIYPFTISEEGIYILTSSTTWDTVRNFNLLIGLIIFSVLRVFLKTSNGLDDYITVSVLYGLYLVMRLIWCIEGRTIIIDHNCRRYEYYKGESLIYRGHLHNVFVRLKGVEAAAGEFYFKVTLGGFLVEEYDITNYSDKCDQLKVLARQLSKNLDLNFIDYKNVSRQHIIRHLCPYFLKSIRKSIRDYSDYDYITLSEPIRKNEYNLTSFSSTSSDISKCQGNKMDKDKNIVNLSTNDIKYESFDNFIEKEPFPEILNEGNNNRAFEMYELIDNVEGNNDQRIYKPIHNDDDLIKCQLSSNTLTYTYSYYENDQLANLQSVSTISIGNLTTRTNSSIFKEDDILDYSFSDFTQAISSDLSTSEDSMKFDSFSDVSSLSTDYSMPSEYPSEVEGGQHEVEYHMDQPLENQTGNSISEPLSLLDMDFTDDDSKGFDEPDGIIKEWLSDDLETDSFSSGQTLDSLTHTLVTTYTYTYEPSIADSEGSLDDINDIEEL